MPRPPDDYSEGAERVLAFIVSYKIANDGNTPTYREIMQGALVSSTSVVQHYIHRLIREYKIRVVKGKIYVTGGHWNIDGRDS